MTRLTDASVSLRATDVVLTFGLDGDLPDHGHWVLEATLSAGPDGPIDQLGFKVLDGRVIAAWSFDMSGGSGQRNYPASPRHVGTSWALVLPRDAVRSSSGTWRAGLDVNGIDGGTVEGTY